MESLPDISTRKEIEFLINRFYERVKADTLLGPRFAHVDWLKHLPVMYNFWSSLMFGDQSYQGNPFQKHVGLPIGAQHFSQWLALFTETVDEHFQGDKAREIKDRAQNIARLFQHKLGLTLAGDDSNG